MTATALVHGPIAALDPMFPVWAIASNDAGLPAVQEAAPLDPLLSIVPGQVFAWALSQVKGLDPDRPTHLTKVTLAK